MIEIIASKETHSNNSNLVKDIIIGMSDGLTMPFALTAGLSAVLDTSHLIIVSGLIIAATSPMDKDMRHLEKL